MAGTDRCLMARGAQSRLRAWLFVFAAELTEGAAQPGLASDRGHVRTACPRG